MGVGGWSRLPRKTRTSQLGAPAALTRAAAFLARARSGPGAGVGGAGPSSSMPSSSLPESSVSQPEEEDAPSPPSLSPDEPPRRPLAAAAAAWRRAASASSSSVGAAARGMGLAAPRGSQARAESMVKEGAYKRGERELAKLPLAQKSGGGSARALPTLSFIIQPAPWPTTTRRRPPPRPPRPPTRPPPSTRWTARPWTWTPPGG